MKYSSRFLPFLVAGAFSAAGCDDDANTTPDPDVLVDRGVEADMVVTDMFEPPPVDMDIVDPDMNLDMDVVDPDMAPDMEVIPDQMIDQMVDQMIDASTVIPPGPACVEDDDCEGEFQVCLNELCSVDFRPDVFVVTEIRINEPSRSAELISTFLAPAVRDHQLNIMVEPGGYNDMGEFLWYIGNGGYRAANGGEYVYLDRYPVQNFFGFWRGEEEGLVWRPDGETLFTLNVPAGTVENAEGDTVTCLAQLVTTVEIAIRPTVDAGGLPTLNIQLIGVLTQADAERVEIPIGGNRFPLTDLLNPEDLNIDLDGDGTFDAYPFDFDVDANSITFVGEPPLPDGSNRDPNPNFMNDPACEE